jgi:hypothetical protein
MSAEQAPHFEHIGVSEISELSPESCFEVTAYRSDHFRSFNILETERDTWIEVSSMGTLPDGGEQTAEHAASQDELASNRRILRDAVSAVAVKHNAMLPDHEQPQVKGDWMQETHEHQVVKAGVDNELERLRVEKSIATFPRLNELAKDGEFGVKLVSSQPDQPPVVATLAGFALVDSETGSDDPKVPMVLIANVSGDETGTVPNDYRIAALYAKKA